MKSPKKTESPEKAEKGNASSRELTEQEKRGREQVCCFQVNSWIHGSFIIAFFAMVVMLISLVACPFESQVYQVSEGICGVCALTNMCCCCYTEFGQAGLCAACGWLC
jgi:hypothetical protein